MSFAQAVIKKSSTPIHYIWGRNGLGEECYWFVCCNSAKYKEITQNFGHPGIKMEDYGVVVAQGSGRIPPEDIKQMLIKEYDVNWDDYAEAMQ